MRNDRKKEKYLIFKLFYLRLRKLITIFKISVFKRPSKSHTPGRIQRRVPSNIDQNFLSEVSSTQNNSIFYVLIIPLFQRQYFIIIFKEQPLEIWDLKTFTIIRKLSHKSLTITILVSTCDSPGEIHRA
jgi:hypothetical protein